MRTKTFDYNLYVNWIWEHCSQCFHRKVRCSFRGDFEICRMLCENVNRLVPNTIEHWLIVPEAEQRMFESLATERCKIIT